MTDTICVYTIRGPFGAVTGYGSTQLEAKRSAEQAAQAQAAQVKREKLARQEKRAELVKQWSIEIPY